MLVKTHDAPVDHPVATDDFYGGDLNVSDFQEVYRVPASVAPSTIARQMDLAVAECNGDLAAWRAEQEADGITAITADQRVLYSEAVFARAYAHLLPMLTTLYDVEQAAGLEEEIAQNEGRFFARSNAFLSRIRGEPVSGDIQAEVL